MASFLAIVALVLSLFANVSRGGITSGFVRKPEASEDMPLDSDVFRVPSGDNAPQQVHIIQGDREGKAVIVSWTTPSKPGSRFVTYWSESNPNLTLEERGTFHTYRHYNYTSGFIHQCTLSALEYDTKYYYQVGTSRVARTFWFKTPPPVGPDVPYVFGLIGDLGQTYDSNSTLTHYESNPSKGEAVLYVGDLSYADCNNTRWDTWGRFVERNNAYQPWIWAVGNHEVDVAPKIAFRELAYRRENDIGYPGRVITSCRIQILKEIYTTLNSKGGDQLLGRFFNGPFGHFLTWSPGRMNSDVVHAILSRALITDDGIWFNIKGSYIEYSIADHALVTGLKFGPSNYDITVARDPINSNFAMAVCNGYPGKGNHLVQVFKRLSATHEDPDGSIHFRLAQLLMANMFVLGHDAGREAYPWLWELSENPDIFNNFPWGAYSYKTLKYYVEKANGGNSYHFFGPAWALVVWAFEVVPGLADIAAKQDNLNGMPRCMKWSFRTKLRGDFNDLQELFQERGLVVQNIMPTDEESTQDYFTSVNELGALEVQFQVPPNLLAQRVQLPAEVRLRRVRRASPPPPFPPPPPPPVSRHGRDIGKRASARDRESSSSSSGGGSDKSSLKQFVKRYIDKKIAKLHQCCGGSGHSVPVHEPVPLSSLPIVPSEHDSGVHEHVRRSSPPIVTFGPDSVVHGSQPESHVPLRVGDVTDTSAWESGIPHRASTSNIPDKPRYSVSDFQTPVAPFVTDHQRYSTSGIESNIPSLMLPFFGGHLDINPSSAIPDAGVGTSSDTPYRPKISPTMPAQEILTDFDEFIIYKRKNLIHFTGGQASMGWADFQCILRIYEEFEKRHIDMYMELLRSRLRRNDEVYEYHMGGSTVICNCNFMDGLKEEFARLKECARGVHFTSLEEVRGFYELHFRPPMHLIEIVNGLSRDYIACNWWNAKNVLIPCEIDDRFIAVRIDMINWKLRMYDLIWYSLGEAEQKDVKKAMKPIIYLFNRLLQYANYYENQELGVTDRDSEQRLTFTIPPSGQQFQVPKHMSENSGAITCMTIERYISGCPDLTWGCNNLRMYRRIVASKIYSSGNKY